MSTATTDTVQRFTSSNPCPICGGWGSLPRGHRSRCHGFLGSDRTYAHCSREEHAGGLAPGRDLTYAHKLDGECHCGQRHAGQSPKADISKGGRNGHARAKIIAEYLYRDAHGNVSFATVRFQPKDFRQKRFDAQGKPLWNLKGVRLVPYRLPDLIATPLETPVFIVEGEKDVERLRSMGLVATCNAMGAGKWRHEYRNWFSGRAVVIIPDRDQAGREHALKVADSLVDVAASVKVVELAGLPEHGDVSDWLDAGGTAEELSRLAEEAAHWERPSTKTGEAEDPCESENDPHRLARIYLGRVQHAQGLTLRYWREGWHRWGGTFYREAPAAEIKADMNACIKEEFDRLNREELRSFQGKGEPPRVRPVTCSLTANVVQALSGMALLRAEDVPTAPAWIEPRRGWDALDVLPARNALIHLPSLLEGKPCTIPPTPAYFCPYALDFDFDPDAPAPCKWLAFLAELWEDDLQSVELLQEWFGYLLTADTAQQKMLMVIGPKRSGKGTIARVLRALIGPDNVASPTLSKMAYPFGLASLLGKRAAIIADARLSGRIDQAIVVERLLSITGEDSQSVDRKHKEDWEGKLMVRFLLISNELPHLTDASAALPSRMLILKLTKSFLGREDNELLAKLLPELPGILLWAIDGWRRLHERGCFLQPDSAKDLTEEIEDLASPIGAFLKDCCRVDRISQIRTHDLFHAWKRWCDSKGIKHAGTEQSFGRNLRAVVPHLKTNQTRRDNVPVRHYVGVGLIHLPDRNDCSDDAVF